MAILTPQGQIEVTYNGVDLRKYITVPTPEIEEELANEMRTWTSTINFYLDRTFTRDGHLHTDTGLLPVTVQFTFTDNELSIRILPRQEPKPVSTE